MIDIPFIAQQLEYLAKDPSVLASIYAHLSLLLPAPQQKAEHSKLELLIDQTYWNSDFLHRKVDFESDSLSDFSNFFSHISTIHRQKTTINTKENIFLFLAESIRDSKSANPLIVSGIQGSGKSSFLHVLYKTLCLCLVKQVPVYIDIQKYIKYGTPEPAIQKLDEDIQQINDLLKFIEYTDIILIIDGDDDSFSANQEISKKLFCHVLGKFSHRKKIVGRSIMDNVFKVQARRSYDRAGEIEIVLNSISTYNNNYHAFIDLRGQRCPQTNL